MVDEVANSRLIKKYQLLHDLFHSDNDNDDDNNYESTPLLNSSISDSTSFAEIKYVCIALTRSMLTITIILLLGSICYCLLFDDKSFWEAMYMSCMTITTVGFGDITPSTSSGKLFTCVYATCGTG